MTYLLGSDFNFIVSVESGFEYILFAAADTSTGDLFLSKTSSFIDYVEKLKPKEIISTTLESKDDIVTTRLSYRYSDEYMQQKLVSYFSATSLNGLGISEPGYIKAIFNLIKYMDDNF